jgi:uncharacterized protein (DUF2252 family)
MARRPEHVLQALREDHIDLIAKNPGGATAKFDKLAGSAFAFFRGTPGLFYRDLVDSDARMPVVLCNGDVHPENLGVMQDADGELDFGITDFDEAYPAPFTWDLKRCAAGFELAARERGLDADQSRAVAEAVARGYLEAMQSFHGTEQENELRYTADNSPKLIRRLLRRAARKEREAFLKKRVDLRSQTFLKTPEIHPLPELKPQFQQAMDGYRKTLPGGKHARKRKFQVKDVALKTGSGTNSLGMRRYYVLLGGRAPERSVILELKELGRPALARFAPQRTAEVHDAESTARVGEAREIQDVGGDRYYGIVEMDGKAYLVRERSPHKSALKWQRLGADRFIEYARVAGAILAQAHARADEHAGDDPDRAERRILRTIDRERFAAELADFAAQAADQTIDDYEAFVKLHAEGQFTFNEAPA